MRLKLKISAILLLGVLVASNALSEDRANILRNPQFIVSKEGKISSWYSRDNALTAKGGTGILKYTYFPKNCKMSKGQLTQKISPLKPGKYIIAVSLNGINLKAVYLVLSFSKDGKPAGRFSKYLDHGTLKTGKKWQRLVYDITIPKSVDQARFTLEGFGPVDKKGHVMIKNPRLVKQEE